MANLTYSFNGVSSSQGEAVLYFLRSNSNTFSSTESGILSRGYTNIVINFGKRNTDNHTIDDGSKVVLPEESRPSLDRKTWIVNINSEAIAGYLVTDNSGNVKPYVLPFEIIMAHGIAHADGISRDPFSGKMLPGASEVDVINKQNNIANEINARTGSSIPAEAVADRGAFSTVDPNISSGFTVNSSEKAWRFLYDGKSIGVGQNIDFNYQNLPGGKPSNFGGTSIFDVTSQDTSGRYFISQTIYNSKNQFYSNFYDSAQNLLYYATSDGNSNNYFADYKSIVFGELTRNIINGVGNRVQSDNATVTASGGTANNFYGANINLNLITNSNTYASISGVAIVDGVRGNNVLDLVDVGTRATVYGAGSPHGYVGMLGSYQSLTLGDWGFSVGTAANAQGLAINGDHANITFAAHTSANIRGQEIALHLQNDTNTYASLSGSGTIDGVRGSNVLDLVDVGTRATVYGAGSPYGYVGMLNSYQSLTLGDWGFSVGTAPNAQGLAINGDHANITFAANTSGAVSGHSNNIELRNSGSINIYGTGNNVKRYDSNNVLTNKELYNEDGTKDLIRYDAYNGEQISSVTHHYDQQGRNTTNLILNDDGSRVYVVNDVNNSYGWSAYSETFNSSGIKTLRYTASDDGSAKAERWTQGWTDPNLPDKIDYIDAYGSVIRSQDIFYSKVAWSNSKQLVKTQTYDTGNTGNWQTVIVNYLTRDGTPSSGTTIYDNGSDSGGLLYHEYFTPAWNFASSVDSNQILQTINPYFDLSATKFPSFEIFSPTHFAYSEAPQTSSYDPFSYFSQDYVGYRAWDFKEAVNTNPFNNYMLINNNYRWYQDFDQSYGNFAPVIIDLNNNGVEINLSHTSSSFINLDAADVARQSAWVRSTDGLLVIDLASDGAFGPDGIISQAKEFSFSYNQEKDGSSPSSDMAALREKYDSNNDGVLDNKDSHFEDFFVWQDINSDGISQKGELYSLKSIGISSVGLVPDGGAASLVDQSSLYGISWVEYENGHRTIAADVAFAFGETRHATSNISNSSYVSININDHGAYQATYYGENGELSTSQTDAQLDHNLELVSAAEFSDGSIINTNTIDYAFINSQLMF